MKRAELGRLVLQAGVLLHEYYDWTLPAMKSLTSVEFQQDEKQKHRPQQRETQHQRQRQLQLQHPHHYHPDNPNPKARELELELEREREQQGSIEREGEKGTYLVDSQSQIQSHSHSHPAPNRFTVFPSTVPAPAPPFLIPVPNRNRIPGPGAEPKEIQTEKSNQGKGNPDLTSNLNNSNLSSTLKYRDEQLGNIYPFSYSLIPNPIVSGFVAGGGAYSFPSTYDLEISPVHAKPLTIDASSCSSTSAIFYTVPKAKGRGKSTSLDLLGTPSILKSFRQLQEPTRFNTSKHSTHSTSPRGSKLYGPPPHRILHKKRLFPDSVETTTATVTATTTGSLRSGDQSSVRSAAGSRFTAISDFSIAHHKDVDRDKDKPLSVESPRMPLRVRMRRDEYYYTDTCSKGTQTDSKELNEGRRRKSSCASTTTSVATNSGRRRDKGESTKIDRSTSPISPVSSTQYLQKLKDLEKITGHFVIQRFFTRTDQDFTIWLEEQLASQKAEPEPDREPKPIASLPSSINVDTNDQNENDPPQEDENETESVPLQEQELIAASASQPELQLEAEVIMEDKPDVVGTEEELDDSVIVDETENIDVEAETEEAPENQVPESSRISNDIEDNVNDVVTTCVEEIEEEGAAVPDPEPQEVQEPEEPQDAEEQQEAQVEEPQEPEEQQEAQAEEPLEPEVEESQEPEVEESQEPEVEEPEGEESQEPQETEVEDPQEPEVEEPQEPEVTEEPQEPQEPADVTEEPQEPQEPADVTEEPQEPADVTEEPQEPQEPTEVSDELSNPNENQEGIDEEALAALEEQIIEAKVVGPLYEDTPSEELLVPILVPDKKCQSSDLVPCECFAKLYLHEESIARLLISLSPRGLLADPPIVEKVPLIVGSEAEAEFEPAMTVAVESMDLFEETNTITPEEQRQIHSETDTESTPRSRKIRIQNRKKFKHSKSFPTQSYELTINSKGDGTLLESEEVTTTVLSIESQSQIESQIENKNENEEQAVQECQDFPSFVFPHPNLQVMRKSNSLDSCLGTDFSSVKTRNDSGNSNSGRGDDGAANENDKFQEEDVACEIVDMDLNLKPSAEEAEEVEEVVSISNKDSGVDAEADGYSGRSNWFGSTDMSSSRQDAEHDLDKGDDLGEGQPPNEVIEAEDESNEQATQIINKNDNFSADSDSESEVVMSENYHARSEAETDTEMTTDGDAVADDDHVFNGKIRGHGSGAGNGRENQVLEDHTDVDEDVENDKDNDLLARMELDELHLEIDKSSTHSHSHSQSHGYGCRNTCTQTNRSLFSSAWSNATGSTTSSATTNSSSTCGSYIDLEVISKKFPIGPPSNVEGGHKRSYLPSSSSCLNFVNCNMNFSVRADESKFKMSVSLPAVGVKNRGIGGGVAGRAGISTRKLQILHSKNLSDKEQEKREEDRDLPSLWAHVRNRLDSKVSLDVPGSMTSDLAVRGDGLSNAAHGAGPSKTITTKTTTTTLRETRGHLPYCHGQTNKVRADRGRYASNPRPQHNSHSHPQQQHFLQSKAHTNDDRIKRSLERLSKLLDIDKS